MPFNKIHAFFSFRKLFLFLLGFVMIVQLAVITYNHLSGYHELESLQFFFRRFLRGVSLSLAAGFLIAYPDLFLIRYLEKVTPWNRSPMTRVAIQLPFAIVIAVIMAILFTLTGNILTPYAEDLTGVFIANALIFAVVNVIVMAILEGWIQYVESRRAREVANNLETELSQIKFEVLKSQINPHFMFNSLNVLSGLIGKDTKKAQQFIDEFSHIYRYVLESIDQPVASLEKELDFARSYLFLQQIRYGKDLTWSMEVPAGLLEFFLPPLTLQVVLENTTKHNIVNSDKPLHIEVSVEGAVLVVRNNIQPKLSRGRSTGLGLKNLVKRYNMVNKEEPDFSVDSSHYIARLPLIKPEYNERTDH